MLKVNYYKIDGCNWTYSGDIHKKIFDDENALEKFIESQWSAMYEIKVISKETIKEEQKQK